MKKEEVIREFKKNWYYSEPDRTWSDVWWLGYQLLKNPMDLWIYQEIIFEVKPEIIIETGTGWGGSALYLASILELIGEGEVLSVDVKSSDDLAHPRPKHKRISYLIGSSVDGYVVREAASRARGRRTMVILDSEHSKNHVLMELIIYSQLVSPKSYLIVEDTQMNGNPIEWNKGEGPMEAVEEFLKRNKSFEIDRLREKFYLTFNPKGFLRKL